jgi:hypothetical protein
LAKLGRYCSGWSGLVRSVSVSALRRNIRTYQSTNIFRPRRSLPDPRQREALREPFCSPGFSASASSLPSGADEMPGEPSDKIDIYFLLTVVFRRKSDPVGRRNRDLQIRRFRDLYAASIASQRIAGNSAQEQHRPFYMCSMT